MLYFGRHGEIPANVANVFAGSRCDEPLNEQGFVQARLSAEDLVAQGVGIDHMWVSPLQRTRTTADVIAEVIDFDASTIVYDKRLVEYDMGALEGQSMEGVTAKDIISVEGAEDPHAFQERVMTSLREAASLSGNTLVISHAGVGRVIEATRLGIDPKEFFGMPGYNNAQIVALGWVTMNGSTSESDTPDTNPINAPAAASEYMSRLLGDHSDVHVLQTPPFLRAQFLDKLPGIKHFGDFNRVVSGIYQDSVSQGIAPDYVAMYYDLRQVYEQASLVV